MTDPTSTSFPTSTAVSHPNPTTIPTASPRVPADVAGYFADVSQRTPSDVVAYLHGSLPDYPGSNSESVLNFSPSNILETMDTIVLDRVAQNEGKVALQKVYDTIAADILKTLRDTDGNGWILVALDAGHGGNKAFYFDAGSEGTEWRHTRAVEAAMQRLVFAGDYPKIILRPVFNDAITDDLGIPKALDRPTIDSILMRQARASMLAQQAVTWNATHPDAPVVVHEISVHFNAGSDGALVLYQGDTVRPEFVQMSLAFGQQYLHRVIPDLNRTGLLPAPLRPWGAKGLHDDVMLYRPDYVNGLIPNGVVLRYGVLQGRGYLPKYLAKALGIN